MYRRSASTESIATTARPAESNGVVEECCHKECSITTLASYCLNTERSDSASILLRDSSESVPINVENDGQVYTFFIVTVFLHH